MDLDDLIRAVNLLQAQVDHLERHLAEPRTAEQGCAECQRKRLYGEYVDSTP